jgi:hypothetical protein
MNTSRIKPFLPFLAWGIAATALWLVVAAVPEPGVLPDELCHLGWSRLLSATGTFYAMGSAGYCEPGYALLLAPLNWLFDDQQAFYRAVLVINAVLAGACLPLALRIGIRHFGMSNAQGWTVGLLALCYPALLVYSRYALPETLLYVLTLTWLGAWARWLDARDTGSLTAFVASAFALYLLHSRMIVFVGALILGALGWLAFHKDAAQRRIAWGVLLAAALMLFAVHAIKQSALPHGWDADPIVALDKIAYSATPAAFVAMASKAAGQVLFAMIATLGLAIVPLAWMITRLRKMHPRESPGETSAIELKAMAAPIMLVLIAVESAVFLNGAERFDLAFYGRYPGPLIVASMIAGLALVGDGRARRASIAVAAIATVCLLLVGVAGPSLPYLDYSRIHVVGALPIVDWLSRSPDQAALWLRLACVVGAVALASILLVRRPWYWYAGACLATMAVMHALDPYPRGPTISSHVPAAVRETLSSTPCTLHWSKGINGRLQNHQKFRLQYLFPHCELVAIESSDCRLPLNGAVIASADTHCRWAGITVVPLPPDLLFIASSR